MKITICGSLDFTHEIGKIKNELERAGHAVSIPFTSQAILDGEFSLEEIKNRKETGTIVERMIKHDVIKAHYEKIKSSDAILVPNFDKKGINNYIGGNTFLEMGFAHVLGRHVFLLNPIPKMHYTDEIRAMQPVVLSGDLSKVV
jgi:hypothetical protein